MFIYLILDIVIVFLSFFIINRKNTLTFYHPGTVLLAYHIVSNTFRFWGVTNGAALAFQNDISVMSASEEELIRGLFWLDMSLVVTSVAISLADTMPPPKIGLKERPFSNKILIGVLIFTIPLGIWGAATQLYIPAVENNINVDYLARSEDSAGATYFQMTQSWFGLSCLLLIYFKGFKPQFLIPLFIYLFIIALQGYARFRVVLPCIFLATTYLYYCNLKWPKKWQIILLLFLTIIFYPLKEVGQIVQEGGDIGEVVTILEQKFESTKTGNAEDQSFLDQYAMTLTEIDRKGKIYYGSTIAPILVMWIPRTWWPEKPRINEWQKEISNYDRPFIALGSIATLHGESYANFRYLGILFIPALLFYFLTRWYNRILQKKILDMDRFFYALIFCCLVQVLRDGLGSLIVFPILNSTPLFLVYILHRWFIKKQKIEPLNKSEIANEDAGTSGALQLS